MNGLSGKWTDNPGQCQRRAAVVCSAQRGQSESVSVTQLQGENVNPLSGLCLFL